MRELVTPAVVPDTLDVAEIRKRSGFTQRQFADAFGIPLGTLRDWEQRKATPEAATRAYLTVIDRERETVLRALSGPK